MIPAHNTISLLTTERDTARRDFAAMSDRTAELAVQLTAMERDRDSLRLELAAAHKLQRQYEAENLRLRELHATAERKVEELVAALRSMTVQMAVGQKVAK